MTLAGPSMGVHMSASRRRERALMAGLALAALGALAPPPAHSAAADRPEVRLIVDERDHRVDVQVAGQPFTSYIWPTILKKPVLHPIRTADGRVVTRGFPPGAGERADHPHHVGLWF